MIVPALVLAMEQAGLGTVNTDLFWEELPHDVKTQGIWVVTSGDAGSTENYQQLRIDIYARYSNKLETELRLRNVINWVRGKAQDICELSFNPHDYDSSQPDEAITYGVISIQHTGAVQNQGVDQNFRIIKTISITIKFNERTS